MNKPNAFHFLKITVAIFCLSLLAFYFIYAPAFNIPFAYHDQYLYLTQNKSSCRYYGEYNLLLWGALRPVALMFECFNYRHAYNIADINMLRLITAGFLSIAVCCLAALSKKAGFKNYFLAFLFSLLMFTLPAAVNFITMSNTADVFAIIVSLLSVYLLVSQTGSEKKQYVYIAYLIALILQAISFFTYPPSSLFFLLGPLLLLLFQPDSQWQKTRRVILQCVLMFLLSALIYFLLVKLVRTIFPVGAISSAYSFHVQLLPFLKAQHFFQTLLPMNLNFWNIYPNQVVTIVVLLFIILGFVVALVKAVRLNQPNRKVRSEMFFAFLVLFALTNIVYLFAPPGPDLYRSSFALMAVLMVLLTKSISLFCRFVFKERQTPYLIALLALVLFGSCMANLQISKIALYNNMEFNYYGTILAEKPKAGLRYVYVQMPTKDQMPGSYSQHVYSADEFNRFSSFYAFDPFYITMSALNKIGVHLSLLNCNSFERYYGAVGMKMCQKHAGKYVLFYSGEHLPKSFKPENTLMIKPGFLKKLTG